MGLGVGKGTVCMSRESRVRIVSPLNVFFQVSHRSLKVSVGVVGGGLIRKVENRHKTANTILGRSCISEPVTPV